MGDAAVVLATALAAALLAGGALLLRRVGMLPGRPSAVLARALLVAWVLGVAGATLPARHSAAGRRVNLELGRTIAGANNSQVQLAEFLVNVLLFVPLGLLLPLAIGAARPLWRTLAVAAAASLGVEVLQYALASGRHTDVDDVLVNVAGAGAGWLAFRLGSAFLRGSGASREPSATIGGAT